MAADVYITQVPSAQRISHTWRTGIQKPVTGGPKKRSALFTWPRLGMESRYDLHTRAAQAWFQRKLYRHTHEIWGVPVWPDKTTLSAQAASGQPVLSVADTDNRHFYQDRDCIIVDPADPTSYESGTISVLASAQITLDGNLAATWAAGSWVMPIYECRIPKENSGWQMAYAHNNIVLDFSEALEAVPAWTYSLPSSGADQYLGHDVFLFEPLQPVTFGFGHPYDLTRFFGMGSAVSGYADADADLFFKMDLALNGRSDIWDLVKFFDSKRGRFDAFWFPSWARDFVATAAIDSTDTVINVQNVEYSTYYLANDVIGRYVFIRFPAGTYACRKITGAAATTITLDAQVGTSVSAADLDRLIISFLHFGTLSMDELALDYHRGMDTQARAKVGVANLIGEAVA